MPKFDVDAAIAEQQRMEAEAAARPADAKVDRGDTVAAASDTTDVVDPVQEVKAADPALVEAKKESVDPKATEAKAAEKAEDSPRDPETGKFIPKARFDEQNAKFRRTIAERDATIAEQQKQLATKGSADITALEEQLEPLTEQYGQLLADGKLVEAKKVMGSINKLNRQIAVLEVAPLSHAAAAAATAGVTLESLVDYYTSEFPMLDQASPEFNNTIVSEISVLQGDFERAGHSPAAALQRAVELLVPKHGLVAKSDAVATPATEKGKTPAEERKASAVDKAIKAANAQPAALVSVGSDSDSKGMQNIRPSELSYGEFTQLPDATLKRLRGDLV